MSVMLKVVVFSILSLALNGLITLYRDRAQERYMFVVDHVNRATGEASKTRESLQYVARQMSLKSKAANVNIVVELK